LSSHSTAPLALTPQITVHLQTTPSGLSSTPVSFHHIEPPGCIPWVDLSSLSLRALAASAAFLRTVLIMSPLHQQLDKPWNPHSQAHQMTGRRKRSIFLLLKEGSFKEGSFKRN